MRQSRMNCRTQLHQKERIFTHLSFVMSLSQKLTPGMTFPIFMQLVPDILPFDVLWCTVTEFMILCIQCPFALNFCKSKSKTITWQAFSVFQKEFIVLDRWCRTKLSMYNIWHDFILFRKIDPVYNHKNKSKMSQCSWNN